MGNPQVKVEASIGGQNSIRKWTSGISASAVGCNFRGRCSVCKEKSNCKVMVTGLLGMPTLLGDLHSFNTFTRLRWEQIWCCYILGKHQQHRSYVIFVYGILLHQFVFASASKSCALPWGVISVAPTLTSNKNKALKRL